MIARAADGSMRDALSLTDQVLSMGDGTRHGRARARRARPRARRRVHRDARPHRRARARPTCFPRSRRLAEAGIDFGGFLTGLADMLRAQLAVVLGGDGDRRLRARARGARRARAIGFAAARSAAHAAGDRRARAALSARAASSSCWSRRCSCASRCSIARCRSRKCCAGSARTRRERRTSDGRRRRSAPTPRAHPGACAPRAAIARESRSRRSSTRRAQSRAERRRRHRRRAVASAGSRSREARARDGRMTLVAALEHATPAEVVAVGRDHHRARRRAVRGSRSADHARRDSDVVRGDLPRSSTARRASRCASPVALAATREGAPPTARRPRW